MCGGRVSSSATTSASSRIFGRSTMPKTPARILVPPLTDAMYESGKRSAKDLRSFDVIQARYDRAHDVLDLTLRGGIAIRIPRLQIRELAGAQPKDLSKVEIQPGTEISTSSLRNDR